MRVLLIDDNVELVENLAEVLEDEGHEVELAIDGALALARIEARRGGANEAGASVHAAWPFDLVITDMRMPGMSGLDVLRRINHDFPGLPVVIMTAYEQDRLLEQAQLEGALGVLPKPLDLGYLVGLVGKLAPPRSPVLVVEDDAAFRVNLCEALLDVAGLIPHPAADLAAARRLASAVEFALAIIDVRLPDGDGSALGKELLAARPGQLRVVYITGYGAELEDTLRSVLDGADVHLLEKPFAPPRLLALLQDLKP